MISESIRRFILINIDSVPHLEAISLLWHGPKKEWDAEAAAQALYINEKSAEKIMNDLCSREIIGKRGDSYFYAPSPVGLKEILDELADIYSKNLIDITNLIHKDQ